MDLITPRLLPRPQPPSDEGVDTALLFNFYREQEEGYIPPVGFPRTQAQPWRPAHPFPHHPQSFLEDEAAEQPLFYFYREQEEGWPFQPPLQAVPQLSPVLSSNSPQSVPWIDLPFLDEAADTSVLVNFYREEEEGKPPGFTLDPFVTVAPWQAVTFTLDDEPLGQLPFFYRENEDLPPAPQEAVPWLARPFSDDETGEPLVYFYRENEDLPPAPVQVAPWLSVPPLATDDDRVAAAAAAVLEDDLAPPAVVRWPAYRTQVQLSTDTGEAFLTVLGGAGQETVFFTIRVETPRRALVSFGDEDPLAFAPAVPMPEQEEFWTAQVQAVPWQAVPFRDDEAAEAPLANFYREQEEPWVGQVQVIPWLPRPALDDDINWFTAPFWSELQDDWNRQVQAVPWLPLPFTDDETGEPLKSFFLEQEEWRQEAWLGQVQVRPWLPLPFSDDEASFQNFFLEQEEFWTALRQTVPWTPVPFTDVETGEPLAYFYREQEEWRGEAWLGQRTVITWNPFVSADEQSWVVFTGIPGPFYFVAGATYVSGASAGSAFATGTSKGVVYVSGAQAGQASTE